MRAILKFFVPFTICIAVFCSMLTLNPHIGYYDFVKVSEAMKTSFEPALTAIQYSRISFDVIEILDETIKKADGGRWRITSEVNEFGDGWQRIWVEGEVWSIKNGWESVSAVSLDVPETGSVDPYIVHRLTENLEIPIFGLPASPITAFAGIAIQTGFLIGKGAFETFRTFIDGAFYIVGVTDSPY